MATIYGVARRNQRTGKIYLLLAEMSNTSARRRTVFQLDRLCVPNRVKVHLWQCNVKIEEFNSLRRMTGWRKKGRPQRVL
jgi:hypothetical protein